MSYPSLNRLHPLRWPRLLWLSLSMLLLSFGAAPAAWALDDPPGRVGRVADLRGQAWLQVGGQGEWVPLQRNRPVTTADRLSTDRDSRLALEIGSSVVRLDGATQLNLQRLDDDRIDLVLQQGSAVVRIREPEVIREFSLQVNEGTILPRGTGLFRVDRAEPELKLSALSGEVAYTPAGSPDPVATRVRAGQRLIIRAEYGNRSPELSWTSLADDDFERWVRDEDAREVPRTARGPVSPEMTGADDLGRYGRWDDHPEYGSVWSPAVVVAGWAPYRYGHWVHLIPWGWTWVDDAPWGFAPFHYGRWLFWGGRWCWAPGQYVRRPVYAPALVGWVGGGGPHWSVSVSVGPSVGWVPLAPREVYVPVYRSSPVYVQNVNISQVHLPPNYRPVVAPGRPVSYFNQGVSGGLTAVPAQVMQQRLPVARAWHGVVEEGGTSPGRSSQPLPGQWVHTAPPPAPPARSNGAGEAPQAPQAPLHPVYPPSQRLQPIREQAPQNLQPMPVQLPHAVPQGTPDVVAPWVRHATEPIRETVPGRAVPGREVHALPAPAEPSFAAPPAPQQAFPEAARRLIQRVPEAAQQPPVPAAPARSVQPQPQVRPERLERMERTERAPQPERVERTERPERGSPPARPRINDPRRDGNRD